MSKIIVFPGTFDPMTFGHENLIARASTLFDKLIVAVAAQPNQLSRFSLTERLSLAKSALAAHNNVDVLPMHGLLVDFLRLQQTHWVLRGMRNDDDRRYEQAMLEANRLLMPEIEAIYLWSASELVGVTASAVREILAFGGDVSAFVSTPVLAKLIALTSEN